MTPKTKIFLHVFSKCVTLITGSDDGIAEIFINHYPSSVAIYSPTLIFKVANLPRGFGSGDGKGFPINSLLGSGIIVPHPYPDTRPNPTLGQFRGSNWIGLNHSGSKIPHTML
jgi:hypothetical protein